MLKWNGIGCEAPARCIVVARLQPITTAADISRLQPTTMLPTTTMASPTPKPMPKPRTIKPRKPKLWLYLDYNGVLNEEGTEALNDFLCLVDLLRQDVSLDINLVSKARKRDPHHCNITCNEIADAGMLNVFTKIVFTTERAAVLRHPCKVEHFDYLPLSLRDFPGLPEKNMRSHPAHQDPDSDEGFLLDDEFRRRQRQKFKEQFDFYHGGKNQFIFSQHRARPATATGAAAEMLRRSELQRAEPCAPDRIIFVDDKSENLEAVAALNELPDFRGSVQCIEMRRKVFRTDWAWHAMSLRSLFRYILHIAKQLLDEHGVEQRSNPLLARTATPPSVPKQSVTGLRERLEQRGETARGTPVAKRSEQMARQRTPRSGDAEGSGAAPRSGFAEQESGSAWTPLVQTHRTVDAFDL